MTGENPPWPANFMFHRSRWPVDFQDLFRGLYHCTIVQPYTLAHPKRLRFISLHPLFHWWKQWLYFFAMNLHLFVHWFYLLLLDNRWPDDGRWVLFGHPEERVHWIHQHSHWPRGSSCSSGFHHIFCLVCWNNWSSTWKYNTSQDCTYNLLLCACVEM